MRALYSIIVIVFKPLRGIVLIINLMFPVVNVHQILLLVRQGKLVSGIVVMGNMLLVNATLL